jgi:OOP family OmpA-OmpF porin
MKVANLSLLAALAAIASPGAMADDSGWYLGGNLGQSKSHLDSNSRDTGYKLFGGYQFNPNFALEGGYFDLGSFAFTASALPPGALNGNYRVQGLNLDAVGILPLNEKWSAFARGGLNYAEVKDSYSGSASRSNRDTNYKYGLGLQYAFTPALDLRLEAERYRVQDGVGNKGNIDLLSLGLVYRFGGKTPHHTKQAAWRESSAKAAPVQPAALAATPVAPVVTKAPALVIVPVPIRTEQYCGILDIQYEIDQDAIQDEEKEKLAALGAFLQKYPESTGLIEGHSDDVGTAEYNQALSRRRADNVVSYLVENCHIAPERLSAVGYGETRPLVANDSELGKRMNRRIDAVIACATDVAGLTVIPARLTMALLIEFDRNQTEVKPQYDSELAKVAALMKAKPAITATVEGHTANLQATPELAMEISQQRAQNVMNALVDRFGIARSRLSVEGFGDTRRFAYNTSLEGQRENRRVNIIFNYPN